jgi:hypothetical protein
MEFWVMRVIGQTTSWRMKTFVGAIAARFLTSGMVLPVVD